MANDVNSVVIIGRLTRAIQLKYLNSGTAVGRCSIAVNSYAGQGKQDNVSFFDIIVWGKQAEALNPYLNKGQQICVNGELRQSRWEQNGENKSKIEIVAHSIQLLGRSSNNNGDQNAKQDQPTPQVIPKPNFPGPENFDDDIPF